MSRPVHMTEDEFVRITAEMIQNTVVQTLEMVRKHVMVVRAQVGAPYGATAVMEDLDKMIERQRLDAKAGDR